MNICKALSRVEISETGAAVLQPGLFPLKAWLVWADVNTAVTNNRAQKGCLLRTRLDPTSRQLTPGLHEEREKFFFYLLFHGVVFGCEAKRLPQLLSSPLAYR